MTSLVRIALAAVVAALVLPGGALAGTAVGQLFPSNIQTVPDATQKTGLRIDLPHPNCSSNPSDCADVAVLDTLDGFNIQPRLTIPFSGPIDPATATGKTIFLVAPDGHHVGINQRVWAPATNTLYAESDEQLAQDTTYLLVVTRGVHDANGDPVDATTFRHDLNFGQTKDPALKAYRKSLLDAIALVAPDDVAAASLFTTQSITAISEKIRAQLSGSPVSFNLGTAGERTVFPVAGTSIVLHRQTNSTPPAFTDVNMATSLAALQVFPGSVGSIAFGTYSSPNYETSYVIPPYGTATGTPVGVPQTLQFTLFVPSGAAPAGGWPTAIFGHGFTDSKDGAPWAVASTLAHSGIATIAINVVGHGGGSLGTYTVSRAGAPSVTLPSGGRGVDQDGNGTIDSTEGVNAVGANSLIGNRDGLRQTTIDLMQLVATIRGGNIPELSTSRIYYAGQSFGGIYGVQLLGLEPDIRAGVPNVPGGPIIEIARLSPSFRPLVGIALITRTPSLYNNPAPNAPFFTNFNENMPLRNQPLVMATPDQVAIQNLIDNTEWAQQAGNPAAYAPHISKPVIIQFARGDQTVPNPTASAIIRAGHLEARTTLFRNDLAFSTIVGYPVKNPHTFLTNLGIPTAAPFAIAAQQQIATFFASDGAVTIDPDLNGPYFETPMNGDPPEDLAFIP
jgi:dienelactone hydrolase